MGGDWRDETADATNPPGRLLRAIEAPPRGADLRESIRTVRVQIGAVDCVRVNPAGDDELAEEWYVTMAESELDSLIEGLDESDEIDARDSRRLLERLEDWKRSRSTTCWNSYEKLCIAAFGLGGTGDWVGESATGAASAPSTTPEDGEYDSLEVLHELSTHLCDRYLDTPVRYYRTLNPELTNLAVQVLNSPDGPIRLDTPPVVDGSLDKRTQAGGPVRCETKVTTDDVILAVDLVQTVVDTEPLTHTELHVNGSALDSLDRDEVRVTDLGLRLGRVVETALSGDDVVEPVHDVMLTLVESLTEDRQGERVPRDRASLRPDRKRQLHDWMDSFVRAYREGRFSESPLDEPQLLDHVEEVIAALKPEPRQEGRKTTDGGRDEFAISVEPGEWDANATGTDGRSLRFSDRTAPEEVRDSTREAYVTAVEAAIRDALGDTAIIATEETWRGVAERVLETAAETLSTRLQAAEDGIETDDWERFLAARRRRAAKQLVAETPVPVERILAPEPDRVFEEFVDALTQVTAEQREWWLPPGVEDRRQRLGEAAHRLGWVSALEDATRDLLEAGVDERQLLGERPWEMAQLMIERESPEEFRHSLASESTGRTDQTTDQQPAAGSGSTGIPPELPADDTDTAGRTPADADADTSGEPPAEPAGSSGHAVVPVERIERLETPAGGEPAPRTDRSYVLFSARPEWKRTAFETVVGRLESDDTQGAVGDGTPFEPDAIETAGEIEGVWGISPRRRATAERIVAGDLAVFYGQQYTYTHRATVLGVERRIDAMLGHGLATQEQTPQGRGIRRDQFAYAVYLTDIQRVDIDSTRLHEALGYERPYLTDSVRRTDSDRLRRIRSEYGRLEAVLDQLDRQE